MNVRARRRSRRGFTLVEVIVALAVMLILAAVALPQMAGYLDQQRIQDTATLMATVRDALYGPSTSFRSNVGANAGRLSHLSTPLVNGDDNSCGNNYNGGQRNSWPNGGPYVNFVIDPTGGLRTPIGQADDLMTRITGGGTWLRINFNNSVTLADAQALDLHVDGSLSATTGTVRWTAQAGTDMATLHYYVAINSTC